MDDDGGTCMPLAMPFDRLPMLMTRWQCRWQCQTTAYSSSRQAIGIPIRVAHLPPYCSKYNPIDHRLFCHLTRAIRGRLSETLRSMQTLFSKVTTTTGLRVIAEIARRRYQRGRKASEEFRNNEPTLRDKLLGKYNYVLPVTK